MRRTPINLQRWSDSHARSLTRLGTTSWLFSIECELQIRVLRRCGCCTALESLRSLRLDKGKDAGHGGTGYSNASTFTYEDGGGRLRVHTLLPRERELITRGGPGWEFWTPGDEFGGAWGSGKNWPLDPPEGGPLPTDPYLRKMWKTFWGDDFEKLLKSNTRAVVPAAWRVEVSPAKPAKEDFFLNVLEIGDKGDARAPKVELVDGSNLIGALIEGGTVTLFATGEVWSVMLRRQSQMSRQQICSSAD